MPHSAADHSWSRLSRLVAPLILLAACKSGTEPKRAAVLTIASPAPSTARSGVAFDAGPAVQLVDQDGSTFAEAGVAVSVALVEQGGTLGGTTTRTTDANGRAAFSDLVISGTAGSYTLRFTAAGLTAAVSAPVVLGAGPAATVSPASPLTLAGTVGAPVAGPPAVVVKDASGNVVPNVGVVFVNPEVGSTLTGSAPVTNAAGVATLGGWTLPTHIGQYTLSATAAGVSTPVIFTATATPDAPQSMQASESGQSSLYGSRLQVPLQARVLDQYGNPTPGVVVTWGSVTGAGTVEPIDVATDADGAVRANYRLGTTPGANLVRASISSRGLSADFSLTALGFSSHIGTALHHSCGLDDLGSAWCWGDNAEGQVGDNTTTDRAVPTIVSRTLTFGRLSVGPGVTCALSTDHVAYCWGSNRFGALGDGTTTDRLVPTPVAGGLRFLEISTSGRVTCGVALDATAWCWGSDESLALGVGNAAVETCPPSLGQAAFACSRVPMPVAGGTLAFSSIAVGQAHACALVGSAKRLYCWGNRFAFGGASNGGQDTWGEPVAVAPTLDIEQVTAGDSHTCATVAAAVYCWGSGHYGALGTGQAEQQQDTPALVAGVVSQLVGAGSVGTCAVLSDGRASCWGYNQTGAVGDGTTTDRTTPAIVASGQTFTAISTSSYHACGRVATGQVYCWGNNLQGQLGNGGGPDTTTPVLARP